MSAALRILLLMVVAAHGASAIAAEERASTPARNPFTRPAYMVAARVPAGAPPARLELRLRATLVSNGTPLANIGGEILAVGETYAGYRVAKIEEGRAVVVKDGERTVLEVYEPRTASIASRR
jgi:hypothetical protein